MNYYKEYEKKLISSEKAIQVIKNGDCIIHGTTLAEPLALLQAIADRARADDLKNIKMHCFNPQAHAKNTYYALDLVDCIETYTWFISGVDRSMARVGLTQFIPSYLYQIPKFIEEMMDIDVTITTVSPMDKAGFFSFGTANDVISTAARNTKKLIVEVNKNMPRVFGDSLLHISEVDAVVENHIPLLQLAPPPLKPEDEKIGKFIIEIIPDGAALQLGIGGIPNAVTNYLGNHKDLGIHSELLGPGMIELIKKGVINGRRKTLHPRKHIFTVAYGIDSTFEFMNDNPSMESYPSSYVLDPCVIAKNDRMVAINSIIEVDLTGQCNSEYIAGIQYSGTGGQLDFVRGAYAAKDGLSIMAFYSTAKDGSISRVVPRLGEGAVVTTPRMDVHYLATEYGIVNLKQKSIRERALAIISIAHPKFREKLLREAEDMNLM